MTAPTPIIVTKCADCPFRRRLDQCGHPDAPTVWASPQNGSTCPIRTSPSLVVLRPRAMTKDEPRDP